MTTSRPAITKAAWFEVKSKFLLVIESSIVEEEIPEELVININHTPTKFVLTDNVTMTKKNSKHVARKGSNGRQGTTVAYVAAEF